MITEILKVFAIRSEGNINHRKTAKFMAFEAFVQFLQFCQNMHLNQNIRAVLCR